MKSKKKKKPDPRHQHSFLESVWVSFVGLFLIDIGLFLSPLLVRHMRPCQKRPILNEQRSMPINGDLQQRHSTVREPQETMGHDV